MASSSSHDSSTPSAAQRDPSSSWPRLRVVERLQRFGVPEQYLSRGFPGLVEFVADKGPHIPTLVAAFFPPRLLNDNTMIVEFEESLIWLQWLMFSGAPDAALDNLSKLLARRGVCGTVWTSENMAYKCRTCERDPSSAICTPCFRNGNHKNHDYSIKHVAGGRCDCGDSTGWKPEGFCTEHKGAEQIQSLPQEYANSAGPVIDCLLAFWKRQFMFAPHSVYFENMTLSTVEMLLKFFKYSEMLGSFVATKVTDLDGFLEVLVSLMSSFVENVASKLKELLLKLLGEPTFKYGFAKVFIRYYRFVVTEAIKEGTDYVLEKHSLISSTFSVQIFTVSTLTPQLVKEQKLLDMLLGCLEGLFSHCAGADGCLQASWKHLNHTIIRVVEDIEHVMSHNDIAKYVTHERGDILRTWIKLLSFLQGMSSLKRETGIHVEEDNDNSSETFLLGHHIANIDSHLVGGAFSVNNEEAPDVDDGDTVTYPKLARHSQDSSVSSIRVSASMLGDFSCHFSIPLAVTSLAHECLKAIENWLGADNTSGTIMSDSHILRRTPSEIKRGKYILGIGSSEDSANADDNSIEGCGTSEDALHILNLTEWPNITFDVSSEHVSVHIRLHRLLARILERSFKKSYGESDDVGNLTTFAVREDFFGSILQGYHPSGFSAFVMEHPLRSRVFCAQVEAEMWNRNGEAAKMSHEYYKFARWCEDGLELDLFLLQCCAALAPTDDYVTRIIERFGLLDYLSLKPYKSSEYEHLLVREMLTLIIQIVQQRDFSGFSTVEKLEKELVYRLSIGDATHTELVECLPCDLSESDQLISEILDAVALYSEPSIINQGKYSLRTSSWKELDLYHPRWDSKELQDAKDKYMHICNVSALTAQLPRWKKIYPPLQSVARIATCSMVLQLIRAVLFYAVFSDKLKDKRAPNGVLLAALHLLSLSLDSCAASKDTSFQSEDSIPLIKLSVVVISASLPYDTDEHSLLSLLVTLMNMHKQEYSKDFLEADSRDISSLIENILRRFGETDNGCFTLLQQLAPEVVTQVSQSMPLYDTNVSNIERQASGAKARERQAAALAQMKAQQSKFLSSIASSSHDDSKSEPEGSNSNVELDDKDLPQDVCSCCLDPDSKEPLSFLVFLQKSRLSSIINRGPLSWDKSCQSNEEHLPENIEASDASACSPLNLQNIVNEFAGFVEPGEENTMVKTLKAQVPDLENVEVPCTSKDANDGNIYTIKMLEDYLYLSIRKENDPCQADRGHLEDYKIIDPVFVGEYVAALSPERVKQPSTSESPHSNAMEVESASQPLTYDRFGLADSDGINLSSCGHAVHQSCFDKYLSSRDRTIVREEKADYIIDHDQGEFLCPTCRRLANSFLPSFPELGRTPMISTASLPLSTVPIASSKGKRDVFLLDKGFSLIQSAQNIYLDKNIMRVVPSQNNTSMGQDLDSFSEMLYKLYFPNKQKCLGSSRIFESMFLWDTLKYSLISVEVSARCGNESTRPTYSLNSLYKKLNLAREFQLSMLLKIVGIMSSSHVLHALQRYRAVQHFGNSICLGVSNECGDGTEQRKCDMMWKKLNKSILLPDIQFWIRAADPVLAHDAFSSFMWVLFCLPQPFLSCEDSLLSLIHLFYSVSILQAIITCCAKDELITDNFNFSESLITDIVDVVRDSGWVQKYFVSHYVGCSSDIKVVIRRLSFPFLRKCALLWKLLRTYVSAQLSSRDVPSVTLNEVNMEIDEVELTEIEELENMFMIPQIDVILKDNTLRELAIKWYNQFYMEYETRRFHVTLHSTPAMPFRLMQLPHNYDDLLHRYMKQHCAKCRSVVEQPALCLLCGRLCNASRNKCCSEAGCETHAATCGAGRGVFILIKDIGRLKGNPLYLMEKRYAALAHMVASHGLEKEAKPLDDDDDDDDVVDDDFDDDDELE
ncbi:E3 ubiquitin-protein ligase PRT6 [Linum perenne]